MTLGSRRAYGHQGNFASGVLSTGAQDRIDSPAWQNGLAKAEHFLVRRDGSLMRRPAWVRGGDLVGEGCPGADRTLTRPRFGALAGATWSIGADVAVDDPTRGDATGPELRNGTFPGTVYSNPPGNATEEELQAYRDGVVRFPRRLTATSADPTHDWLTLTLPPGVDVRGITFHGARLRRGRWSYVDPDRQEAQPPPVLTFQVLVKIRGSALSEPGLEGYGTDRLNEADPFAKGTFCPGLTPRDITVPLDAGRSSVSDAVAALETSLGQGRSRQVEKVFLRVRRVFPEVTESTPLDLVIRGITLLSDAQPERADGTPDPAQRLRALERPYRLLPWSVLDTNLVVALSLHRVVAFVVPDAGLPRPQIATTGEWLFTARQLRELTWTQYPGALLLCHRDFPHPLRLQLPERDGQGLRIGHLPLRNVPMVPDNLAEQARISVGFEGGCIFIDSTVTGTPPSGLEVFARQRSLFARWTTTDAPRYRLEWGPIADYARDRPLDEWVSAHQAETTQTAHLIENLPPLSQWVITVQERRDDGTWGPRSRPLTQVVRPEDLDAPADLAAVADPSGDGAVRITWTPLDRSGDRATHPVTTYAIQWSAQEGVYSDSATQRSLPDGTELVSLRSLIGQRVHVRIRAERRVPIAGGTRIQPGDWTTQDVIVRPAYLQPGLPADVAAAATEDALEAVRVSWTPGLNATGHEVQWKTPGQDFSEAQQARVIGSDSYVHRGGVGTSHEYQVRAFRGFGPYRALSGWVNAGSAAAITWVAPGDRPFAATEPVAPEPFTATPLLETQPRGLLLAWTLPANDAAGRQLWSRYELEWGGIDSVPAGQQPARWLPLPKSLSGTDADDRFTLIDEYILTSRGYVRAGRLPQHELHFRVRLILVHEGVTYTGAWATTTGTPNDGVRGAPAPPPPTTPPVTPDPDPDPTPDPTPDPDPDPAPTPTPVPQGWVPGTVPTATATASTTENDVVTLAVNPIPNGPGGEVAFYRWRYKPAAQAEWIAGTDGNGYAFPAGSPTSVTIRNLRPGTWYNFQVSAGGRGGYQAAWSGVASAQTRTPDQPAPPTPGRFRATPSATDTGRINLSWEFDLAAYRAMANVPNDATVSFGLQFRVTGTVSWGTEWGAGDGRTFTWNGFAPDVSYDFQLRAHSGGATSEWTSFISRTAPFYLPPPGVPGGLAAIPLTEVRPGGYVLASWNNAPYAQRYVLAGGETGVDGGDAFEEEYETTGFGALARCASGRYAQFRVKAENTTRDGDVQESAWSGIVSVQSPRGRSDVAAGPDRTEGNSYRGDFEFNDSISRDIEENPTNFGVRITRGGVEITDPAEIATILSSLAFDPANVPSALISISFPEEVGELGTGSLANQVETAIAGGGVDDPGTRALTDPETGIFT